MGQVGASRDSTTVVGYGTPQTIAGVQGGSLQAEEITFHPFGSAPATVMLGEGGRVDLMNCRFTGGVGSPEIRGHGLVLAGAATGRGVNCRF